MWIEVATDGRITGVCETEVKNSGWLRYEGEVPQNWHDYVYQNGVLVHNPLPVPAKETPTPERVKDLEDAVCELAEIIAEAF